MKEKFSITGMSCAACSAGIERTLQKAEGVFHVEVSLMGESMVVEYDETRISPDNIIQTVVGLGYGATVFEDKAFQTKKPRPELLKKRFFLSLDFSSNHFPSVTNDKIIAADS